MDILNLIIGLFIIGIGFLVKYAPNLIAGYNTMPKEKKKNVDIEGLSTFMRNGLIIIGLIIIIGYYVFKWIGFSMVANLILPIVTLIGITILVIYAQRFDHNKHKKTKLTYFIFGLVILLVFGLLTYGLIPAKTIYSSDTIQFSGMYGFEVPFSDIKTIELTDSIPLIKLRTNGFSLGTIKKGFFNLDKLGKCRLLIHSDIAPYLILSKNNGDKIIINFKDKIETKKVYNKIKVLINK